MKQMKFLVISLTALFLVSGCIFGGGGSGTGELFVGGKEGLHVSFITNAPPEQVYYDSNAKESFPFTIQLLLDNRGEYRIPAGDIQIQISNYQNFGLTQDEAITTNVASLTGRQKLESGFSPGGVEYIEFEDVKYIGAEPITSKSPVSLSAEVCYPYQTTGVATICVAKSPTIQSDICKVDSQKKVHSSGGPIKVSGIIERSSVGVDSTIRVVLDIEVTKIGDDLIYKGGSDCSNLDSTDKDVVRIEEIVLGSGNPWVNEGSDRLISNICGNTNEINLENGRGTIKCTVSAPKVGPNIYEERFVVKLGYVERIVENTKVEIISLG